MKRKRENPKKGIRKSREKLARKNENNVYLKQNEYLKILQNVERNRLYNNYKYITELQNKMENENKNTHTI